MSGTALRRLTAEYKQLILDPPEGICASPMNDEDFFTWEVLITGPKDTCFEDGVYAAQLIFPSDYPMSPPKMKFTCEIFHPNVYPDGYVCISILHQLDQDSLDYEPPSEHWCPVLSVEKILLSVLSILADPNEEAVANSDAAFMWRENREKFNAIAKRLARKTLGLPA